MGVTTQLEHSSVEGDFKDDLIHKEISAMSLRVAVGAAPTHSGEEPETGGLHLGSDPVAMI